MVAIVLKWETVMQCQTYGNSQLAQFYHRMYPPSLCWVFIVAALGLSNCESGGTDLDLDGTVYQREVQYDDVQTTTCTSLVSVRLTRPLFSNESISADLVGREQIVQQFAFNDTLLSVCNSVPLSSGRYEFSIVIIINGDKLLIASAVINVLSPIDVTCDEQAFGKCSQNCQQNNASKFGYDCYCEDGYILQLDNLTCLAFDPYPRLLVSTNNSIFVQEILNDNTLMLVSANHTIGAFDYSTSLEVVYFVSNDATVSTVSLNPSESLSPQSVHHFGDVIITDIAVDWTNEDIYFVDNGSSINVWKSASNTTQQILNSLDRARDILFSSNMRRVIWINGNSSVMWISLNDNNTISVINDVRPSAISVHPVNGELYCIDDSSIFSIDQSSNIKVVFNFENEIPLALDVFEVFAFVLLSSGQIKQINIHQSLKGITEILSITNVETATDIRLLHPLKQMEQIRILNCESCDHSCIIINHQIECVCDRGFQLSSNGYSCFPSESLEVIFSSYSVTGSAIVSANIRRGVTHDILDQLYQDGPNQRRTGIIYGVDFDQRSGVLYYGERDLSSIWSVSMDRISDLQDDRNLIVSNATVWGLSYDWLNDYLYWTDDVFNVVARKRIASTDVSQYEIFHNGNELKGIVVDPINGWLFWIDEQVILRSGLDGMNLITFHSGLNPSGLTIDYISRKLYWSDASENSIWESTLEGLSQRVIFADDFFSPFLINIVRNYVIVTSRTNTSYALINLDDTSVGYFETPAHTLYHGVSVVSLLKKPSIGRFSCLEAIDGCSHFCEANEVNGPNCGCPKGYDLLGDGITCIGIEECSLCPDNSSCYNIGRNISCECPSSISECSDCEQSCINGFCEIDICVCNAGYTGQYCENECLAGTFGVNCTGECECIQGACDNVDGACSCDQGYTGSLCDSPICEFPCLNGGTCSAPNECLCVDTFGGINCSERVCTSSFCHNGGTCIENFDELECRCPATTSGPQCQFNDVIVIPIGPGVKIGAPIGIILFLVIIVASIFIVIFWLYARYRHQKKFEVCSGQPTTLKSRNLTLTYESIRYAAMKSPADNAVHS